METDDLNASSDRPLAPSNEYRVLQTSLRTRNTIPEEPDYVRPDFGGSRQIRIRSIFIEQFVAGHDSGDVLRELVQIEFDGGGDVLRLTFGRRSPEVAGSGRNIDAQGMEPSVGYRRYRQCDGERRR